jgi:hypothetical protein
MYLNCLFQSGREVLPGLISNSIKPRGIVWMRENILRSFDRFEQRRIEGPRETTQHEGQRKVLDINYSPFMNLYVSRKIIFLNVKGPF